MKKNIKKVLTLMKIYDIINTSKERKVIQMIQIQSFSNPMAREVTVQANNWLKENDYHIEVISTQMVVKSNDRILEVIIMITYKEFEEKHLTND